MMKAKKLTSVVAILMMLVLFILPLSPSATALLSEKGSITLNLTDSETETPLANVSFRLYFIAKAYKNGNGIRYELISPFDEANINTDDLQDSLLPVHLAFFADTHSQPYAEKSTDENGVLVFDNLTPGLYLVVPSQNGEDSCNTSPFVISIPNYDSRNGTWQYNVNASPKILDGNGNEGDSETYISVVKKWDTDKAHPESITVVLLRDFQKYEEVQLNEGNNWHYRWDNLPKNHVWNVVELRVPRGYTVHYETSSNTVTIINKSDDTGESTTKPSETDKEEDDLAHTGQLNWPVPVCAIAGLLIFSIGWAILNFGRKESE